MAIIQCANWREPAGFLTGRFMGFDYGQDGRPVRDASGQPVVNGGAIEDIVNDADTAEGLPSPIKTLLTGSDLSVFQGTLTELSDTRMSGVVRRLNQPSIGKTAGSSLTRFAQVSIACLRVSRDPLRRGCGRIFQGPLVCQVSSCRISGRLCDHCSFLLHHS